MQISPLGNLLAVMKAAAGNGASGAGGTGGGNQLTPNSFIQLLSAQLQAQTPDDTVDPNQMMTELVQFNTLQQVTEINQELGNFLNSQTPATPPPAGH